MSPDLYNLYYCLLCDGGKILKQTKTKRGVKIRVEAKDNFVFDFELVDNSLWLDPSIASDPPVKRLYNINHTVIVYAAPVDL